MKPTSFGILRSFLSCLAAFDCGRQSSKSKEIPLSALRATWACTGYRRQDLDALLHYLTARGSTLIIEQDDGSPALMVSLSALLEVRKSNVYRPISARLRGVLEAAAISARGQSSTDEGRARRVDDVDAEPDYYGNLVSGLHQIGGH